MEKIKQVGSRLGFVVVLAGLMVVGAVSAASAQTTDPVAGAFDDMESKITTYGAAIVGLVVLSVGIFLGLKYLRKGVSKA